MTTESTRAVDAIADRFVEEYAALDPVGATFLGLPGHDGEVTDLSPDGFAARTDLLRRTLTATRQADPVDERERAAKEALVERLQVSLDRDESGVTRSEVSVISSGLHELRSSFDLMDTASEAGWSDVLSRLRGVPKALADYRRTLLEAADTGLVSARRQYAAISGQVRRWTAPTEATAFFPALVASAGADLPATLRGELRNAAQSANDALAQFGRFLDEDMTPRGRERDGVGRDAYTLASRYFLGAEVDLEETYAWGWHELHRIETEMAGIAGELLPGAGIDEVARHLDDDPQRHVVGKEAFRDWMQQLADRTLADLAGTHFDIPEPVRRIECRIAPTQDGGVYYTGPSEDFSRPGRMWWSVPAGIERFHPWRETTTVFHEGVPGHHLQVGQTAYRREELNRWQRQVCWVSGSGEGWALYAERLMDELGCFDDPAARLGFLDAQAMRAARVAVDIGVHLDLPIPTDNPFGYRPGDRWDAEVAFEFMRAHCRIDEPTLRFEVNRYLGWPGQAPSYKVGERLWLEARDLVRVRRGQAFDLKTFHRQALDLGAIGLGPLTAALERL